MEQTKKISKLKIIIPIVAVVIIAIVGIVIFTIKDKGAFGETKEKIYEIGETAKTNNWEFTLTDVQFGKKISANLSSENYSLPNEQTGNTAKEGNLFCTITYNIKYLGTSNAGLFPTFELISDNNYIIKNNDNLTDCLYIRNNLPDGYKVGNSYKALWEEQGLSYEFQPLSSELKVREFMEVPENTFKEEGKSLILKKELHKPGNIIQGTGESVKYKIK